MATDEEITQLFFKVFDDLKFKRLKAIDSWSSAKKVNKNGFLEEKLPTLPPWFVDLIIEYMIEYTNPLDENKNIRELEKFYKNKIFDLGILIQTNDLFILCDTTKNNTI